ncbi:hypothetical protein [Hymenobacter chitinivorans]|uniref:hypothetical protein n=1 Tax=Hymenobacter chitinivorans TaxID=89969 RepID=UPI0012FD77B9|nr:hypothetical protein [Hymenobacter chitinivorans]
MIIPQTAALVIGGPLLLILFSWMWTTARAANPAHSGYWWEVAASGALFNIVWLTVLIVLDSDTWNNREINKTGLFLCYMLPIGGLAIALGFRSRLRPALVFIASCLCVFVAYLLK